MPDGMHESCASVSTAACSSAVTDPPTRPPMHGDSMSRPWLATLAGAAAATLRNWRPEAKLKLGAEQWRSISVTRPAHAAPSSGSAQLEPGGMACRLLLQTHPSLPLKCPQTPPAPPARRDSSALRAGRARRPRSPRRPKCGPAARRPHAAPAAAHPAQPPCRAPGRSVPAMLWEVLDAPCTGVPATCRFCSRTFHATTCQMPSCHMPAHFIVKHPDDKLQGRTHFWPCCYNPRGKNAACNSCCPQVRAATVPGKNQCKHKQSFSCNA